MLNNLTGWHFLIILGVLALIAAAVLFVVLLAIRASRRLSSAETSVRYGSAPSAPPADPVEQLKLLGDLREQGLISEGEFETKRTELLGRI